MHRRQHAAPAIARLGSTFRSRRTRPGLEPLEDRCIPAVFSVNSLADVLNPGPGIVTLRSAIQQANMTAGGNSIELTLPGTYRLTLAGTPGETDNVAGELAILPGGGDLTIENASGGQVIIDGNHLSRVFDINPTFDPANPTPKFLVTLTGLTIQNGLASSVATPDGPAASGGGIRDNGNASLTLNSVVITNNSATADGGGVVFENTVSVPWTFTANNSVISNNHAGDAGGGVDADGSGKLFINPGTVISGNTCVNQGAGIWLDAIQVGNTFQTANLTVTGAVVAGNTAQTGLGGGIGNAGNGTVTITSSTIASNFTGATGGGFGDEDAQGVLVVQNSLFQGNSSAGAGGGIAAGGPSTTITSSEIKGNSAGGNGGGVFGNGVTLTISEQHHRRQSFRRQRRWRRGGNQRHRGRWLQDHRRHDHEQHRPEQWRRQHRRRHGHRHGRQRSPAHSSSRATRSTPMSPISGGGIAMASGGTVDVQNTIIAQNQVPNTGPDYLNVNGTHFTSQGGNLVGIKNDATFNEATDQTGTAASPLDPLLGPLQNNGGPTLGAAGQSLVLETQALLTGSPAISKGIAMVAPVFDERGFQAATTAVIDVGAYLTEAVAAGSAINLTASVPSAVAGQPITFTATVTPAPGSAITTTPIGTVTFTIDGVAAGSLPLDVNGTAALVVSAGLPAGPHSVSATYSGGGSYGASSNTMSVLIGQAASSTQLITSATNVTFGQPVTLTATVAAVAPGIAVPSGLVTFLDGITVLGTASLLNGGQAVFTTNTLGVGSHMLTAMFGGNGNLTTSTSSPTTLSVTKAMPTVTLLASSTKLGNGQPLTLVAVVSGPPGVPAPTGLITFFDNGKPLTIQRLNAGVAFFTTSHLRKNTANVITASYSGDGSDLAAANNTALSVLVGNPKHMHSHLAFAQATPRLATFHHKSRR